MAEPIDFAPPVLCFGGEDWWYHNRAHVDIQLMRRFAQRGQVLYINSVVMRRANVSEGRMFFRRLARKVGSMRRGVAEAEPGFFVYSPVSLPVHHLLVARALNQAALRWQVKMAARRLRLRQPLVWVACPAACDAAIGLQRSALVYQRTDRYEEYPGVDWETIAAFDRRLKAEADVTFYVSRLLFERERGECRQAYLLDHGVDYEHFANAESDSWVPEEMRGLRRPVVGFFGDIEPQTVDINLSAEVADRLPQMDFVFVGTATVPMNGLSSKPNVRLVPRRPYEQIPHYGKCFDVAIMPWQQNAWIEACNPIKLKEYLALGKPVVSTPFSELEHYGGVVYEAASAAAFADAIERAIHEDSPQQAQARRERVENCTWNRQAQVAVQVIAEATR